MSKKETLLKSYSLDSAEKPKGLTYKAMESEIWRTDPDGSTHLAVVFRAVDGSLSAKTRTLAKLCADFLNQDAQTQT